MIIINLNIRGLGGTKSRYLRQIIANESAEIMCLQETKTIAFSDVVFFFVGE